MDLKQLEYIVTIAEEKNISRAAEKLYLSQPTLSQYLSRLEQELGIHLFNHNRNAFTLTDAGKIYVDGAKQILNIKKNTYKRIEDLIDSKNKHLAIGVTPGRGAKMLADILPKFYEKHPDISIQVTEEYVKKLEELTQNGHLDVAMSAISAIDKQNQFLDYDILCEEEIVMAVPKTHRLAHMAENIVFGETRNVDISLFKNDSFVLMKPSTRIRDIIDNFFETVKIKPNIFLEVQQTNLVCNIVSKGMAIGFIPKSFMVSDANMVYFSVTPKMHWKLGAIYRKGFYLTRAIKDFREMTKQYLIAEADFSYEK